MALPVLPDEMWDAILERVDATTAFTTMRSVRKRWREQIDRIYGPSVWIQSHDDIRHAKKMPKVGVLCIPSRSVRKWHNCLSLENLDGIRQDSFFSEIASVLNKTKHIYLRHVIEVDCVEEWVVRTSGAEVWCTQ